MLTINEYRNYSSEENSMAIKKARKSKQLNEFVDGFRDHVSHNRHLPTNTAGKRESSIQGQLFAIFVQYLEDYYEARGHGRYREKAASSFYWEGQAVKKNRRPAKEFFASRNYPDFVIQQPYSIAIEYKQSEYGSLIKQAIGQSMVHILNQEYDFVYILFNDQTKGKMIKKSLKKSKEQAVCKSLWENFNIKLHII